MGLCKEHGAAVPLNESPSEKEGKFNLVLLFLLLILMPSMKVPPKRKGNAIQGGVFRKK